MRFAKNLYVGEGIKDKAKVRWKLKHNAGQLSVYVVCLASGEDLLEIYHCAYLQQQYYKKNPPYVVGIANGYDEALELVRIIINDIFAKTGNYKIKDYLLGNCF